MTNPEKLTQALAHLRAQLSEKVEKLLEPYYCPPQWRRRQYFRQLNPSVFGIEEVIVPDYHELKPEELEWAFWQTPLAQALLTACQAYEPQKASIHALEPLLLEAYSAKESLESFLQKKLPSLHAKLQQINSL